MTVGGLGCASDRRLCAERDRGAYRWLAFCRQTGTPISQLRAEEAMRGYAYALLRDYGDYETYLQTIVGDATEVVAMLEELAQLKAARGAPRS